MNVKPTAHQTNKSVHRPAAWYLHKTCGLAISTLVNIAVRSVFKKKSHDSIDVPLDDTRPVVIAANHQKLLDAFVIMQSFSLRNLLSAPVKFMTWHKYYNSRYKLPLYIMGSYPSHGPGLAGTSGAIAYAELGYRSFIFPEGKRTSPNTRGKAYPGVSTILTQLPEARLILAHITWEKRSKLLSRPLLRVHIAEAPDSLDRSNPESIMNAIYAL